MELVEMVVLVTIWLVCRWVYDWWTGCRAEKGSVVVVIFNGQTTALRILAAHLRQSSWRARLAVVGFALTLIWVGLCNAWLLDGRRRRRWFFPSGAELRDLLAAVGFADLSVRETYSRQAWLVVGMHG